MADIDIFGDEPLKAPAGEAPDVTMSPEAPQEKETPVPGEEPVPMSPEAPDMFQEPEAEIIGNGKTEATEAIVIPNEGTVRDQISINTGVP